MSEFRYWAFLSYSHTDNKWGDWLHKSLEGYRVPRRLVGQKSGGTQIPARLFPIFRDREELPVSSDLGGNIKEALQQSRYLIVVCSPRAAASRWVGEEIKIFKMLGRENRILAFIVDGEPNASEAKVGFTSQDECFPEALRYRLNSDGGFSEQRVEPIAADARKGKDGKQDGKLKLIAGLIGANYDDLKQRERRRVFRRRVLFAAVLLAIALLIGGISAWQAKQARDRRLSLEREQQRVLRARTSTAFLTEAVKNIEKEDYATALAYLGAAVRNNPENRHAVFRLVALLSEHNFLRPVGKPMRHQNGLETVRFSQDDKCIVTASRDQTVRIWDGSTGNAVTQPLEHNAALVSALFNSNGNKVFTDDRASVRVWDAKTGQLLNFLRRCSAGGRQVGSFSANGSRVALTRFSGGKPDLETATVEIVDTESGKTVTASQQFSSLRSQKVRGDLSLDGSKLLISCSTGKGISLEGLITVWDIEAQRLLWAPISVGQTISRFSPNGRELFVESARSVLEVRDALTGLLTHSFNFGDNHISQWRVSPDGNSVAIALLGGGDNAGRKIIENWKRTTRTWELAYGYRIRNDIEGFAWSPDSTVLVDLPRGIAHGSRDWWNERWRVCDRDLSLSCAEFSGSGNKVLTGSQTGKVRLWQIPTNSVPSETRLLSGEKADFFASSKNSRRILASFARSLASGKASVFWLLDGESRQKLTGPTNIPGEITGARFSTDTTKVAAVIQEDQQTLAVILDGNTGKQISPKITLYQFRGKEPNLLSNTIAWSGDSSKVAFTLPDQVLEYDITAQQVRRHARDSGGLFTSSEFSPNGKQLFTFSGDGVLKWNLATNTKEQRLITAPTAFGCLSPDGNIIALSVPGTGSFQFWNVSDGTAIGLPIHSGSGSASLEFNSRGDHLLVTTDDAFRIWAVTTGAPLTESVKKRLLRSAHFIENGELIITTSNSGADFWSDDGRHLAGPVETGLHVDVIDAGNTLLFRSDEFLVTRVMPGRYCNAPEWLPDFTEAMCGWRVSAGGVLNSLEDTQPQLLEASFSTIRSSPVGSELRDWALRMFEAAPNTPLPTAVRGAVQSPGQAPLRDASVTPSAARAAGGHSGTHKQAGGVKADY